MRRVFLFISVALVFAGCSKEENISIDYNEYINVSDEYVMFQNVVNENLKWIYRIKKHPEATPGSGYRKVYVTKDTTIGDSAVYILDYRKAWNDYDGVHKDSLIHVAIVGEMTEEGDKAYVNLNGFTIKDRMLHGKLFFEHKGAGADTNRIDLTTQNLGYSDTTGRTHELGMNQQFKLELFYNSTDSLSLRFSAGGEAQGKASNSKDYSITIADTSLVRDSLACTRIQSGHAIMDLSNEEESLTYIDFNRTPPDSCNSDHLINIDDNKYETTRPQLAP